MPKKRCMPFMRIKTVTWIFGLCLSVIAILKLGSVTRQPTVGLSEFSDYVNRRFQNDLSSSAVPNDAGTTIKLLNATTTLLPIRDDFRNWFDMRTPVHPFVPSENHPFLPAIIGSNNVCANSSVDILIYVFSACENNQRRRIMRETWASVTVFKDISVRVVFVVGLPSDPGIKKHLKLEQKVYRDLIQGDFADSFRNLTYKAMITLKWINDNCAHARYIIKSDDDIFINIMKVVEELLPMISLKTRAVMCHYVKGDSAPIIRNPRDRWYVPSDILPKRSTFPEFCSGYAVIMTTDVIPLLYEASFRAPVLSIDDVYMFGLLPLFSKKLTYFNAKRHFTLNIKHGLKQYSGSQPLTYIVASASIEGNLEDYWTGALAKLSTWAQRHTPIVTMRKNMGPAGSL